MMGDAGRSAKRRIAIDQCYTHRTGVPKIPSLIEEARLAASRHSGMSNAHPGKPKILAIVAISFAQIAALDLDRVFVDTLEYQEAVSLIRKLTGNNPCPRDDLALVEIVSRISNDISSCQLNEAQRMTAH